jgi:hypothetical protein
MTLEERVRKTIGFSETVEPQDISISVIPATASTPHATQFDSGKIHQRAWKNCTDGCVLSHLNRAGKKL